MLLGCSSSGLTKKKPEFGKPDLSSILPPGPPTKAVAAWDPAVRHAGDETPQRGFGGRVYFYDSEAKKPIKIKGNIVVYAFDEENRKPDDNAPTRSYYFAKDDVKKLYSKSKLGHSYNLWVPWDAEGPDGKVKKVSLIVRYVPDSGASVVSSQAIVYLPGKANQDSMLAQKEWQQQHEDVEKAIRQVSYLTESEIRKNVANLPKPEERLIESNENRPIAMQTATISIPSRYSQGMEQALKMPSSTPNTTASTPNQTSNILPVGYVEVKPSTAEEIKANDVSKKTPQLSERREAFKQKSLRKTP